MTASPELISTSSLTKRYTLGGSEIWALKGVDLAVRKGEFLSLVGASGSGKSTLLNLIAGLDTPTSGLIETPQGKIGTMSPRDLARYRARFVGMIFQSFNLVSHRTALTNVELALYFTDVNPHDRTKLAADMLTRLGLGERLHHRPADLSGGEQQRVAVARALVKNPEVLLADEPTGNLDRDNSLAIAEILANWNRQGGTVVMVTHNLDLAEKYSHRVLRMDYGNLAGEISSKGGRS
jgi:putative ABC transport system ATP-binding protein